MKFEPGDLVIHKSTPDELDIVDIVAPGHLTTTEHMSSGIQSWILVKKQPKLVKLLI